MIKPVFSLLVAVLFADVTFASWETDGEYFQVLCRPFSSNKIQVRLENESAKEALAAYEGRNSGNSEEEESESDQRTRYQKMKAFAMFIRNKINTIDHVDKTCPGGWIREGDFKQAVAMFVAGIDEFKDVVGELENNNHPYVYLHTKRKQNYNPLKHMIFSGL